MKRLVSAVLAIALCAISMCALATDADYTQYTDEELLQMRNAVNGEIATRIISTQNQMVVDGEITLREMFPSLPFAKLIRDKAGLVSIDQPVTQEALDRITSIDADSIPKGSNVDDLTGIEYLTNLRSLYIWWYNDQFNAVTFLPEGIEDLKKLEVLNVAGTSIYALPDNIGNLAALKTLNISGTKVETLPDSICNLSTLEELIMSGTEISKLPESIGNLTALKRLSISNTKIVSLPASIYNLTLTEFNKTGLDIE